MKAISCAAPGQLALIDIDPPVLQPGWVRVGIRHIGICGTDYHIFEGSHPFLEYPRIMGHELSRRRARCQRQHGAHGRRPGGRQPLSALRPVPRLPRGQDQLLRDAQGHRRAFRRRHGRGDRHARRPISTRPTGLSLRDAAMVEFLAIGAHAVRRSRTEGGRSCAGRRLRPHRARRCPLRAHRRRRRHRHRCRARQDRGDAQSRLSHLRRRRARWRRF